MKTALVTGAGSGIGRATAETLARDGWRVYATDIDTERLERADGPERVDHADTPNSLDALDHCVIEPMDVTNPEAVAAVRDQIDMEVGGLDCLVANAGLAQLGPVPDVPTDRLESEFAVNVHGVHRTLRAMLPLLDARNGTAVVVSSTHARITTPGMGAYAASKHALEALIETLRMELADLDVDIALVEPAWVETEFGDASMQSLEAVDRSARFDDVYEALAEGTLIGGRALSIAPERVAAKIQAVATAEQPALRHPVGWQARAVLATRWLPDPVQSWLQRRSIRVLATIHGLRGRDG